MNIKHAEVPSNELCRELCFFLALHCIPDKSKPGNDRGPYKLKYTKKVEHPTGESKRKCRASYQSKFFKTVELVPHHGQ